MKSFRFITIIRRIALVSVLVLSVVCVKNAFADWSYGGYDIGYTVACPSGTAWNGSSCVQSPPPAPAWMSGSCPAPGTSATISWAAVSGASQYSYRIDDTRDGWVGAYDQYGDTTSTSFTFSSVPGVYYSIWVHARGPDGSWSDPTSAGFTCTPPAPTPSLTIQNTWGISSGATSGYTYYGAPYTVSWGAVANASSCTLNGSSVSTSGGSSSGSVYATSNTFTLSCNGSGGSGSSSVSISVPPDPASLSGSCDAYGTTGSLSWSDTSGWNSFYLRVTDAASGSYVVYDDGKTGTTQSFGTTPGHSYSWWIHTRYPNNGAWSNAPSGYFTCPDPTVSVSASTPYSTTPGATVGFSYSASTPSGSLQCRLLDNNQSALTSWSTANPIYYGTANGVGSYGYYVQCYNTSASSVSAISNQVIVNTACPGGTGWNGSSCVGPSTPTLGIYNTWGVSDGSQSGITYSGAPYTVSWPSIANATSCTLDGSSVSVSGGSSSGTANFSGNAHTFTLTCSGPGGSGSAQVVIYYPPPVSSVASSCSSDGATGTLSWVPSSGYTTFYTRVYDTTTSSYVYPATDDAATGTSKTFSTTPSHSYSVWVHQRNTSNGAWSTEVYSYVTCPSLPPAPTLTIQNTWGISNGATSGMTYYGAPYTLSWPAVANATSCSLNTTSGSTSASVSGGSSSGTATTSTTYYLVCTGPGGGGYATATINVPPSPSNPSLSCSSDGTAGTFSWSAPSGYNTFYARVQDQSTGGYALYDDGATGTSEGFGTTPGRSYSGWVHTRNPSNGAWSQEVYAYVTCPNPTPTATLNIKDSWGYTSYVHQDISTYAWNDSGVYLNWSSQYATACTVYDNGSPRWGGTSNEVAVGAIGGASHTYVLSCSNPYTSTGGDTRVLTIPQSPTGATISSCTNNYATLTWSQNPAYGKGAPYIYDNGALAYNGDATTVSGGNGSYGFATTPGHTYSATLYARDARESAWPYSNAVGVSGVSCPSPSGSLSVSPSCTIPSGGSSCSVGVSWNVSNGYTGGSTAVTFNSNASTAPVSGTVAGTSTTSGSTSQTISYGTYNFFLYHNGSQLGSTQSATSVCQSGTAWDGATCVPAPTVSISASPTLLTDYGSATISWSSTNATSCTLSGYGAPGSTGSSGSFTTPTETSTQTYTATCTGAAGTTANSVTVYLDVCNDLAGYQSAPPAGTTRKSTGACTPVCVNFPDNSTVPPGWTRSTESTCSYTGTGPICPNLGDQVTTVPTYFTVNESGSCVPDPHTACAGMDYCSNINGIQASVPIGYKVQNDGTCTLPAGSDYCPNISGQQSSIPVSQTLDSSSNCVEWTSGTCPASSPTIKVHPVFIEQ